MWKIVFTFLAAGFAVGIGAMVGGFSPLPLDDAGALSALNFAVVQHNKGTNDAYLNQVADVVNVESQVVAGIMYRITVRMVRTNCRKGTLDPAGCSIQDQGAAQPYQCVFKVWSKPWSGDITLTEQKCTLEEN
ncbi:cystatin C (amyloid angiopathy and cerebral hemorrhage) [Symphorus nematophorus]